MARRRSMDTGKSVSSNVRETNVDYPSPPLRAGGAFVASAQPLAHDASRDIRSGAAWAVRSGSRERSSVTSSQTIHIRPAAKSDEPALGRLGAALMRQHHASNPRRFILTDRPGAG